MKVGLVGENYQQNIVKTSETHWEKVLYTMLSNLFFLNQISFNVYNHLNYMNFGNSNNYYYYLTKMVFKLRT